MNSRTINRVQAPIIAVVAEWTRNTPGTLSLGQGMVFYPPPERALAAIRDFGQRPEEHQYGAALGDKRLLELIAEKLHSENQINPDAYQIMITAGANMPFLRFSSPFNGEGSAKRGYNSKRTLATPLCDLAKEVGTEQPSIFELG